MTPQQRVASTVSLGSMSINGISNTLLTPQHQMMSATQNNTLQQTSINTLSSLQNTPLLQTPQPPKTHQLPSTNNVNNMTTNNNKTV